MKKCLCSLLLILVLCPDFYAADEDYYTEDKVFGSRPRTDREMDVGHIGPTGILARVYRDVVLKVEGIQPDTPADGLLKKGDVIKGVNGVNHKGKNLFIVLGNAITEAEAKDGKLLFEIERNGEKKQVLVTIPILGSYSPTWPVNCEKSRKIIENAAEYYSKQFDAGEREDKGVANALVCLFPYVDR
jgi:hypothetical protein